MFRYLEISDRFHLFIATYLSPAMIRFPQHTCLPSCLCPPEVILTVFYDYFVPYATVMHITEAKSQYKIFPGAVGQMKVPRAT